MSEAAEIDARFRRRRLGLRFADPPTERLYLATHAAETVPFARRVYVSGTASWIVAWIYFLVAEPEALATMTIITWAIMVPLDVIAYLTTLSRRLRARVEPIATIVNLVAGLCMLEVTFGLLEDAGLAVGGLILTAFYAVSTNRLRAVWAILGTVPYLIAFAVATLSAPAEVISPQQAIFYSVLLGLASSAAFVTAIGLEAAARTVYGQRGIIAAQKIEIEREKQKSDDLLANMLPGAIAERLKAREGTIAEGFGDVTVLFADIVGFTALAEARAPTEVVELLNRLFTAFDELADRHGVEKIKTIGDAYMAVAGAPRAHADHAEAAALLALDMRAVLRELGEREALPVTMRIGLYSGPVVAGVIGKRKFAYDLWGDTVNSASRMESHGVAGEIQVGESTYERLRGRFAFRDRGVIQVKGKGPMRAFLLDGRADEAA